MVRVGEDVRVRVRKGGTVEDEERVVEGRRASVNLLPVWVCWRVGSSMVLRASMVDVVWRCE